MEKTAVYEQKKVFVYLVDNRGTYAIISYTEDGLRLFKVDIKDLSELNFKIVKEEIGIP